MAYTLGSLDLIIDNATYTGAIESERVKKGANLDNISMPRQPSSGLFSFDFNGAEIYITIRGSFKADSIANLKIKADELRALVSGSQSTIDYISEFLGTVKVKVSSLNLEKEAGVPLMFKYDMELIECDPTI